MAALKFYGDDYPTDDGTAVRDYIHVMDLPTAMSPRSTRCPKARPCRFTTSAPGAARASQLIGAFEKATSVAVPHVPADRRPGDASMSTPPPTRPNETSTGARPARLPRCAQTVGASRNETADEVWPVSGAGVALESSIGQVHGDHLSHRPRRVVLIVANRCSQWLNRLETASTFSMAYKVNWLGCVSCRPSQAAFPVDTTRRLFAAATRFSFGPWQRHAPPPCWRLGYAWRGPTCSL